MEAEFLGTIRTWAQDYAKTVSNNDELQLEVVQGKTLADQVSQYGMDNDTAGAVLLLLGNSFGAILTDLVENNEEQLEDPATQARALYANELGATFVVAANILLNGESNDDE